MKPANRWLLLIVLLVLGALAVYALKFRALFAPPARSSPVLVIPAAAFADPVGWQGPFNRTYSPCQTEAPPFEEWL